ncbi:MAG: hypothetical protein H6518_06585 [Microthrixaceae bacterium]|nr:hypothetical protein [Microthrixaceae bacterium]
MAKAPRRPRRIEAAHRMVNRCPQRWFVGPNMLALTWLVVVAMLGSAVAAFVVLVLG